MRLFEGTVAVITGATGGIGSATARLFAREGAKLVVAFAIVTSYMPPFKYRLVRK